MICSSPLQIFKDLVPNCREGEQFVNPRLVDPLSTGTCCLGEDWIINPLLAKVPVHLRRTQSTVHCHWFPNCDHISQLMPKWNSCCTVGDLALLSQQLYFISILCLPECIATAHPLCMLKIWSVRVLGSGQPIYIKCRQHCWLFRCCTRLYHVHNLIFCIFRRCYNMTFRIQPLCYRGFI